MSLRRQGLLAKAVVDAISMARASGALARVLGFLLGLVVAAVQALALVQARAASVPATANVSATILAPAPMVSVVESLPAEVDASTGTVLVRVASAWVQPSIGAELVRLSESSSVAGLAAAMLSKNARDGSLRDGMLTVVVSAAPWRAAPNAPASSGTVNVLVEYN
jgi:hypothetical protein